MQAGTAEENLKNMRRMNFKMFVCSKKACITAIPLFVVFIFCTPFLRNIACYPFWPNAWREMGTVDVITLEFFTDNVINVEPLTSCSAMYPPKTKLTDIDTSKIKMYSNTSSTTLRSWEHSRFLPTITLEDKVQLLHTYLVLAEALRKMNVEHFFVQGSLLGVHRHEGVIPWDDDIDITVNVSDWKLVRHGLSCIEGFVLSVTNYMHWKFYSNSTKPKLGYPFVDIFFYTENERFIWAVSKSTSRYLVFAKEDTFPLTTGPYEGLQVPVPKNRDHVLQVRYGSIDVCQSRGMDHKTVVVMSPSQVSSIPCLHLAYLYKMYHLGST